MVRAYFFSFSSLSFGFGFVFVFSFTLPHFRGQLRAIIAGCLSGFASLLAVATPPLSPSTPPGSQRFFVLFVVNFLVVVLSVACNLFVYFWRRLHQIRQCRQAESFLSLSPSSSVVPFVMLVFCVCQFYASSSKLCVQMAFT